MVLTELIRPQTTSEIKPFQIKEHSARKLAKALVASEVRMRHFREHNLQLVKAYAGPYYTSQQMADYQVKKSPVNTMYTLSEIFLPNLVTSRMRVRCYTKVPQLRDFADLFELAVNHLLDEIKFSAMLERAAMAALYGYGLTHTCVDAEPIGGDHDFPNRLQDPGWPFTDNIDMDNHLMDPECRAREAADFEGHKFWTDLEDSMDSGYYDRALLEQVGKMYRGEDNVASISKSQATRWEEFREKVCLAQVWLPNEGVLVALPGDPCNVQDYLREEEWKGPEMGPYDLLGFSWVPGNPLPVPPMSAIFDMHVMLNAIARKLQRQAARSKKIVAYTVGHEDSADTMRMANDGEFAGVLDVNAIKEVEMGGAMKDQYEAFAYFREYLNWVSGNPASIGGLEAREKTLGQDELKLMQASARLYRWQEKVREFAKDIIRKIGWYLWHDAATELHLEQKIPRGITLDRVWKPKERQGEFPDYNFAIEPYSVQTEHPMHQYRRKMELLTQLVVPLLPAAQAQGLDLDIGTMLKSVGDDLDIKDLDEWVKPAQPLPPEQVQQPAPGPSQQGASPQALGGRGSRAPVPGSQGPGQAPSGGPRRTAVTPAMNVAQGQQT